MKYFIISLLYISLYLTSCHKVSEKLPSLQGDDAITEIKAVLSEDSFALDELWQEIFTAEHVRSPYLPIVNDSTYELNQKDMSVGLDKARSQAKLRQQKLEAMFASLPKTDRPKYLVLDYIFKQRSLLTFQENIDDFSAALKIEVGRLLISECHFAEGIVLLDGVYKHSKEDNKLQKRAHDLLVDYAMLAGRVDVIPTSVDLKQYQIGYLLIEPPVEELEVDESLLSLNLVTTDIKYSLEDDGTAEKKAAVIIENQDSSLSGKNRGLYWPANKAQQLTLTSDCKGEVKYTVYRIDRDDVFEDLKRRDLQHLYKERIWYGVNGSSRDNHNEEKSSTRVNVPGLNEGRYLLTVQSKFSPFLLCQKILVSSAKIFVRQTPGAVDIVVTDMRNGKALTNYNLDVEVFYNNKTVTYQAKTDSSGLANVKLTEKDYNLLQVTSRAQPLLTRTYGYNYLAKTTKAVALVWAARPLYKKGEKVNFKGIIKTRHFEESDALKSDSTVVVINDPVGQTVFKQTCRLSSKGTFYSSYNLPEKAKFGEYTFLINGQKFPAFELSEFQLPKYQISIENPQTTVFNGDALQGTVSLKHLNNTPLAKVPVHLTVSYKGKEFYHKTLYTDKNGRIDYFIGSNKNWLFTNKSDYKLAVLYHAASGEYVEDQLSFSYCKDPFVMDISSRVKGDHYLLEVEYGDRQGASFKADSIYWHVYGKYDQYIDSADGVQSFALKQSTEFAYVCCTVRKGDKTFTKKITLEKLQLRKAKQLALDNSPIKISSSEFSSFKGDQELKISINSKIRRNEYSVLLMGQNEKVWYRKVLSLRTGDNKISVKMQPDWGPNIYFHAILLETNKQSKCQIKMKAQGDIKLQLKTSRQTYSPNDTCMVAVLCKDSEGQPIKNAEVSLAVVDGGLFLLNEDKVPALATVFKAYMLKDIYSDSYSSSHNYGRYFSWLRGAVKSCVPAIDEDALFGDSALGVQKFGGSSRSRMNFAKPRFRKNFTVEAYWNPVIKTDDSGRAMVSFNLPDSITNWRITAKVIDDKGRVGQSEKTFNTSLPLEADVLLPRILRAGDLVEIPYRMNNRHRSTVAQLRGYVAVDGEEIVNLPPAKIRLQPNQQVHRMLKLEVPSTGTLKFTAIAEAEKKADALTRELTIQASGYHRRETSYAQVTRQTHLDLPRNALKDSLKVDIRLESSLAARVNGALDRLLNYRYGCAEQTISRFTPLIVVNDSLRKLNVASRHADKMPQVIGAGLKRLYELQNAGGGWGWYSKGLSDYRISTLVLEGLTEAASQGVYVRPEVLENGARAVMAQFFTKAESAATLHIGAGDASDFLAAVSLAKYANIIGDKKVLNTLKLKVPALQKRVRTDLEGLRLCELLIHLDEVSKAKELFCKFPVTPAKGQLSRGDLITISKRLSLVKKLAPEEVVTDSVIKVFAARKNNWWIDTRTTHSVIRGLVDHMQKIGGKNQVQVLLNSRKLAVLNSSNPHLQLTEGDLRGATLTFVNMTSAPFLIAVTKEFNSLSKKSVTKPEASIEAVVKSAAQKKTLKYGRELQLQRYDVIEYELNVNTLKSLNYCRLSLPRPAGVSLHKQPELIAGIVNFEEYNDSFNFFIESLPAGKHKVKLRLRIDLAGKVFSPKPELSKMYGEEMRVKVKAPQYWIMSR